MMPDNRVKDRIVFYLPGMFHCNGVCGQYPAISITGERCDLQCDHCRGRLLQSKIPAVTPQALVEQCQRLAKQGNQGVLLSGGCDMKGRLPWSRYIPAIEKIARTTKLNISIHSGLVDLEAATKLKQAGVNQVLIDVVGDDATYREICHMSAGVGVIETTLSALEKAGLEIVPHIICGLHRGSMRGEHRAVEMLARFDIRQVVVVALMLLPGEDRPGWQSPPAQAVARVIANVRQKIPGAAVSLGCARQRGNRDMERLAIDAGVTRMALPSEEAVAYARKKRLEVIFQKTCCSAPLQQPAENWLE